MLKSSSKSFRKSGYRCEPESGLLKSDNIGTVDTRLSLRFEVRFFSVLALSLVFYFIAGNIGSGWIYLLCSSMLAALLMSATAPLLLVLAVTVHQHAPRQFVAGQQASIVLKLRRIKLPLPVNWLRLDYRFDEKRSQRSGSRKLIELLSKIVTGSAKTSSNAANRGFKVIVSLDDELDIAWTTEPLKRGVHRLGTATLSSCFPVGLLWWQRSYRSSEQTITVYPKPARIDGYFLYRLQPSTAAAGGPSRGRQSARQSNYTRGIREYVRGDSPRIVHWASSARTGRLVVREFETEGMPQFDVLLDLSAVWTTPEQFELAVTTACSLLSLGHRLGIAPRLFTHPSVESAGFDLPSIPDGIELQMEILARVNPIAGTITQPSDIDRQERSEHTLIVIRPEAEDQPCKPDFYLIEIAQSVTAQSEKSAGTPASHRRDKSPLRTVISSQEDIAEL